MRVGGCDIDGFEIGVEFGEAVPADGGFYYESLVFLPDLGIGYLAAYANIRNDIRPITVTTLEAIE